MKNVDDDLQVIEHDPLAGRKSVNRHGPNPMILFQARFDFIGDRFELRLGRGRANHEEVRKRRDRAQIKHDDLFRLFVRGEFRARFG